MNIQSAIIFAYDYLRYHESSIFNKNSMKLDLVYDSDRLDVSIRSSANEITYGMCTINYFTDEDGDILLELSLKTFHGPGIVGTDHSELNYTLVISGTEDVSASLFDNLKELIKQFVEMKENFNKLNTEQKKQIRSWYSE